MSVCLYVCSGVVCSCGEQKNVRGFITDVFTTHGATLVADLDNYEVDQLYACELINSFPAKF